MHHPLLSKFSKYPPRLVKYFRNPESRRLSHGMEAIACDINENSSEFKENTTNMKSLVNDLRRICAENLLTSNERAVSLHQSRHKLLVRDRINKLLDNGSAFLELSQVAGYRVYGKDELPAGGIVTGIGQIAGAECMIIANDATVKGGTYYPVTVRKHVRAQEIAEQNHLPCVYLVDSGGANLNYADEVFTDRNTFGRIFYNMANLSAKGIPQVAVVLGSCTAGGAYIPSMADESVIVRGTGSVFLAGPPLVKAALGETVTTEELGGADVHCRVSGVTDHYAENEEHALYIARKIIGRMRNEKRNILHDYCQPKSPLYPSEYLYGVVEPKKNSFDVKKVIACLVDGSEMDEFKPLYDDSLVTGFARINGFLVGILGNNNVLFSESALKATHFIQLCCQRKIPLLFLHNVTGYMVGKDAESGGIAKNGAKMVNAVSCAQVPKISVIIGNSFGAANFGMCGVDYSPRFLFLWPNARTGIMGSEQAVGVLTSVGKMTEDEKLKLKSQVMERFEERNQPYYASARLWNDGIIDPAETRKVLSLCLSVCMKDAVKNRAQYGIFRT